MKTSCRAVWFVASVVLIGSGARVWAHTDVTPAEARELIDSTENLLVVDVRERSEYCDAVGHIPGAVNYPLSSGVLQARYDELPMDRPILVVCRSGGRSNSAANFLDSQGFPEVYDMTGGMNAWQWGTAPCKYAGGSGTPEDPYQIATAADLIALGADPNDYDKHFILTADIDLDPNLPGGKVFENAVIAGAWKLPFTGVFDGNGHTISHLTIEGEFSLGLFGQLGWAYQKEPDAEPTCMVTNLAVEDVNIVGSVISAGALAAYVEWAVVSDSSSTGQVIGKDTVGGLVGHSRHAVINCHSGCTVIGDYDVGGLVGRNDGPVMDCSSTGTVKGGSAVGGLVGYHRDSITQSYSTGAVSGKDAVGGLVGRNGNGDVLHSTSRPGDIDSSYSTAAVEGETCVGGLIGEYRYGSVRQCYSTGAVSGNAQVGGLASGPAPATDVTVFFDVTASFWDVETSGLTVSGAGQGKTTAQMQTAGMYLEAGWDFVGEAENGTAEIWWIDEGQDYPRLWWELGDEASP